MVGADTFIAQWWGWGLKRDVRPSLSLLHYLWSFNICTTPYLLPFAPATLWPWITFPLTLTHGSPGYPSKPRGSHLPMRLSQWSQYSIPLFFVSSSRPSLCLNHFVSPMESSKRILYLVGTQVFCCCCSRWNPTDASHNSLPFPLSIVRTSGLLWYLNTKKKKTHFLAKQGPCWLTSGGREILVHYIEVFYCIHPRKMGRRMRQYNNEGRKWANSCFGRSIQQLCAGLKECFPKAKQNKEMMNYMHWSQIWVLLTEQRERPITRVIPTLWICKCCLKSLTMRSIPPKSITKYAWGSILCENHLFFWMAFYSLWTSKKMKWSERYYKWLNIHQGFSRDERSTVYVVRVYLFCKVSPQAQKDAVHHLNKIRVCIFFKFCSQIKVHCHCV